MAIKGKKKGKARTARVATAPRPFLVPPKVPWFRRTSTKVALVVVLEALFFATVVGAGLQSEQSEYRRTVSQFGALVEANLFQSGAAQQLGTAPLVLPEMGQAIGQLQAGEGRPRQIAGQSEGWSGVATNAAQGIGNIDTDRAALQEARDLMNQGLSLYSGLAQQVGVAARLEGQQRERLVGTIAEQLAVAAQVFDRGWGKLQEERRRAGVPIEPASPPGPLDPELPVP